MSIRPAIRVAGLRKSFASTEVLRGVDLDVAPGTIFALLGPNGSGNAMRGVDADLARFGVGMDRLVKVNAWLRRIGDLPEMDQLFAEFFPENGFPARMTATTEFVDEDCLVMVDGVAYTGD